MRRAILHLTFLLLLQQAGAQTKATAAKDTASLIKKELSLPVKTKNFVVINGTRINYTATTGYLQIKTEDGKPRGNFFFIAYTRDDAGDVAKRPVTFTFNGGPGSSSVWLHMGVMGPKRILMTDDGASLQPPYSYVPNEYSWLDKTDLVFIDPIGTGYSRAADGVDKAQFHGYVEDIESVGEFIRLYTTQNKRWASPKFLAGESYGTTRAAGLSNYLQTKYNMYLNGVVLISSVLNFGTILFGIGNDLPYSLYLPSYAATAWYYKKLPADLQQKELSVLLKEVENFSLNDYTTALMKGSKLSEGEHTAMAKKLSRYTGLSEAIIRQADLRINLPVFNKELLRKEGKTVGRLDSRFTGTDFDNTGAATDYDPSYSSVIAGPYTASVLDYFTKELNYTSDLQYYILGGGIAKWNYSNVQNKYLNVAEDLRQAMAKNPFLKVWVLGGYYDFATPYFAAEYVVKHMNLRPDQQKNIQFTYYPAGHMVYIHKPSLIQMKEEADLFYQTTLKPF